MSTRAQFVDRSNGRVLILNGKVVYSPNYVDPPQYSMRIEKIRQWSSLEQDLSRMSHYLSTLTKCNVLKPVGPWAFGYSKRHTSRANAIHALERSRDWFALWMGLLSYLITVAETRGKELQEYPGLSSSTWVEYLLEKHCKEAWLESFLCSEICDYTRGSRVGVFIDLQSLGKVDCLQPSVEWFCQWGIPVWYIWDGVYAKDPSKQYMAPLSHQLQLSTTTIAPQPSTIRERSKANDELFAYAWQEFFESREKRNQQQMETETMIKRRSREERTKNPPHSAKVFVWKEAGNSGIYVRVPVSPQERGDVLAMFSVHQVRYDSFANEYDCSQFFGPGDDYNEDNIENRENSLNLEVTAAELSERSCTLFHDVHDAPKISLIIPGYDDNNVSDWLPHYGEEGETIVDTAESEILDILRLYFGYTSPLPPVLLSSDALWYQPLGPKPIKQRHPTRPSHYKFDVTDYAVYRERSAQVLLHNPAGRAALMAGGYHWRIAAPIVSFEVVFSGPVPQSGEYFTANDCNGDVYIDNKLTEFEEEVLSGLYECYTGQGNTIARKSWLPLHSIYQLSGQDYGRWTENSEVIFDIFDNRNSSAIKGLTNIQRQPQSSNKWRDGTRGSGQLRRGRQQLEKLASDLFSAHE
ncbi:hypothetical protein JR316_0009530 [Psilocybe cubensis]|uniref:Uncharacterized protein n=1 Tax=Psilocybe cubensis TaxID=181762 RepID=A0ACB8GNK9_PSICU|nr:hypothetical protein JR316_0009530 [Psilocybe cubensis]KAH9477325.1 hypothetical protein JR316_0009530 [Psilocybe cubensis]